MNPTRRRSTRASLPFTLPSKELTATDWAGLVETAIGKDSKGYQNRLSRWILTTKDNPRSSAVSSLRLASFWYQELLHAADLLQCKNAEYAQQLQDLSGSTIEQLQPDYLHRVGCIDDLIDYERDILQEQRDSLQRRSLAINRILQKGELHGQQIQSLALRLRPFLYLPDSNSGYRDRRSAVNPKIMPDCDRYISASPESSPSSSTSAPSTFNHSL